MKKYIKRIINILIIMAIILPINLPVFSYAIDNKVDTKEQAITLNITLERDEVNPNLVHIMATDSKYNITDLKYVHQYIETSNIDYFEQNNTDVYTFRIHPSQTIEENFELDGYGSYTVYAKNEKGDRFLARLTVNDPNDMPKITLIKSDENPLILTIHVTSNNDTITKLKIAKKENIHDNVDFSTQGTSIQFTKGKDVTVKYTNITEEGLYVVYAEDSKGNKVTSQIYLAKENTPISVNISDGINPREVKLQIIDAICDIVKVKVAKSSEISDFKDFETIDELAIIKGQNVNVTYQAPEDDTYVFYIEDEAGYKFMTRKRITTEENSMKISIVQDEKNPGNLTITATDRICNIIEMKIAIGNNIDIEYFKNNGENILTTPGKQVIEKYTVDKNCIINVYIKDEQGYSYMYTKTLIGINEPKPNHPPEVTLTQNENNAKQINVIVRDKDSSVDEVKWAEGIQNIEYFKNNGTRIGQEIVGSVIRTQFIIENIGNYTVYARDEEGNETVKTIEITNIDETPIAPDKDTTPPSIKTTNEVINNYEAVKVTIHVKDTESQIATVKIANGTHDISYFKNGGTTLKTINSDKFAESAVKITQNGTYTIYAEDEAKNSSIHILMISEIKIPEPVPDDTITSSIYEIHSNTISQILQNTNISTFKNHITTKVGYKILDTNGLEVQDTDIVGTGYTLITDTNKTYTLIVTGDINSDGKITLTDISKMRKHYLNIENLEEVYIQAVDMNDDNKITLNDISLVRKLFLDL